MAGAHCATFPFLSHPIYSTVKRTKPPISASVAVPTRLARRRNYLRPKILKTLTRPDPPVKTLVPPQQPVLNPVLPIESPVSPSENDSNLELSSDQGEVVAGEGNEVEELTASETTPEYKSIVGKFSAKSIFKFGVYLVGIYLFQAFFSVWLLGDDNPDEVSSKLKNSGLSKSKGKVLNTNAGSELGNVVYLDEIQLDERIEEIRAMAREARKQERKELKGSSGNEDGDFGESSNSKNRIGIEKEVGDGLVKLQRRLSSKREKLKSPFVSYLGKHENVENENPKEGVDDTLLFKKTLKFKSGAKTNPKGFGGLEEQGESTRNVIAGNDGMESTGANDDENQQVKDSKESVSETLEQEMNLLQNDGNHSEKGTQRVDSGKDLGAGVEPKNGTVQRTRRGKSSEGVKPRKSRELGKKKSQSKREIQETTTNSDKKGVLSVSRSSRQKEAEKEPVVNTLKGNQSKNEIDPWWLDLPYVLVILMRRGSGSDGQGGLYTLKPQNQSNDSYTVAFEDRVDANNFCLLLESFFDDLGDFRADIAPLPNKELREAIKSDNMRVIFVKKGKLQLYAGQPMNEVEMALRSLVEHN